MRRKLAGVLITAGLLVGVGAAPAAAQAPEDAKGCPFIGVSWSAWATGELDTDVSTGEWTGQVASTGQVLEGDPYEVDGGPGVVSQVIDYYCEEYA